MDRRGSTRRVDELVQATGLSGISKSQVSERKPAAPICRDPSALRRQAPRRLNRNRDREQYFAIPADGLHDECIGRFAKWSDCLAARDARSALFGTLAFLLNYVPILGPVTGMVIFFFVGIFAFPSFWQALIPAAIYLGIHMLEGETITPMLLARRFTLNPVVVISSLMFWDWLWHACDKIDSGFRRGTDLLKALALGAELRFHRPAVPVRCRLCRRSGRAACNLAAGQRD